MASNQEVVFPGSQEFAIDSLPEIKNREIVLKIIGWTLWVNLTVSVNITNRYVMLIFEYSKVLQTVFKCNF
jgi:hypothetical protein